MKTGEIRDSFLQFFNNNAHHIEKSSSLIPHNDPSLMFTNSGMVQFKDYFTGKAQAKHESYTSSQKCLRAGGKHNDLDNVGKTRRHHTFFEMLGNFSFGEYFKEKAILYAWDFLTKDLALNKEKLYLTVYSEDLEAFDLWKKITGFNDSKIIKISTSDNFWSMGDVGPCGPCSEIFYDHGESIPGGLPGTPDEDGDRYMEIWNLVFMQYEQHPDGSRTNLPKPCIDTGMGLERISAVMQGVHDNFEIDSFQNIINFSKDLYKNDSDVIAHKVLADHIRAMSFLIADGISPSNVGRGYVLRRIMRRAMRFAHRLNQKDVLLHKLFQPLCTEMGNHYGELKQAEASIISTIKFEEERFKLTLEKGIKILEEGCSNLKAGEAFSGELAFKLHDTYGFPLDLTQDYLAEYNMHVNLDEYDKHMQRQRQQGIEAWKGSGEESVEKIWHQVAETTDPTDFIGYTLNEAQALVQKIVKDNEIVDTLKKGEKGIVFLNQTPFYAESGGQVGDTGVINDSRVTNVKKVVNKYFAHYVTAVSDIKIGQTINAKIDLERRRKIMANHSATHILHYVLRKQLGNHVVQKGSLVSADYFRFDFAHAKSLSNEEVNNIEQEVNEIIIRNNSVSTEVMPLEKAQESGAMALFGEKYDDEVRVVQMADSIELCGGTHVTKTGDIGVFTITNESAIAAGIRRIEAKTGLQALKHLQAPRDSLNALAINLKTDDIVAKVEQLQQENKDISKALQEERVKNLSNQEVKIYGKLSYLYFDKNLQVNPKDLKQVTDSLRNQYKEQIILLMAEVNNSLSVILSVPQEMQTAHPANDLLKNILPIFNGKGGGNKNFAQASGNIVSPMEIVKGLDLV